MGTTTANGGMWRSVFWLIVASFVFAVGAVGEEPSFLPGDRVLLGAHNCYPYQGKWADRLERALATGLPVGIEQDVAWYTDPETGESRSIVSHGAPFTGDEPTLDSYFLQTVRPMMMEVENDTDRSMWPIITLDIDFKDRSVAHCLAVRSVLQRYGEFITAVVKTDDIADVQPLEVKPLLVLIPGGDNLKHVFYDDLPIGARILAFGQAQTNALSTKGLRGQERFEFQATVAPEKMLDLPADNWRRWWNNSWYAVEAGGAPRAGEWTAQDRERLNALVNHGHTLGYWIRFYTLNGHEGDPGMGWSRGYNFGSLEAVQQRWRACYETGVDFIASDMYEDADGLLDSLRTKD